MKLLIGTKNPGKVKGAKEAFELYYDNVEIEGVPVCSDVPSQPIDDKTYQGAKNRVTNLIKYAKENDIYADFYLGIESGMINLFGKWVITNIAVIIDNNGYESIGTGPSYPIPEKYVNDLKNGTELGSLMDNIFNENNLKSSLGGISCLTRHQVSRIDLTKHAFIMALTQFINGNIWSDK